MRKSGDPYITHPLAVTTILADIGMTEPTLVAALLHDTVEDTAYTLDELRADFGDEVALLVDGVTKLDKVKYGDSAQAETIRKMIVAMSQGHPGPGHQARRPAAQHAHPALRPQATAGAHVARDPRDLRAAGPPARHEHAQVGARGPRVRHPAPKIYDEIVRMVAERAPSRDQFLAEVIDQVEQDLKAAKIKAQGHRPAQALLLDLPEDDRRRPRVLRHLRPGRHPHPRRRATATATASLGVHALPLEPGAGAVQGLRRDAEVQHVPVAAHDGDRPAGQAGRAADPHLRHAPPRRVRRRRALEVQGEHARPASTPTASATATT